MDRPYQASYLLHGLAPEEIFAALLDVRRFPDWALGLRRVRVLDAADQEAGGPETGTIRPGTGLEFTLSAAGLTHEVRSRVFLVEPPCRLRWRYTKGAEGVGGWLLEDAGTGTVRMTLSTDYRVNPAWLNKIAHRPFFRRLTEDLLRRSMRHFEEHLKGNR